MRNKNFEGGQILLTGKVYIYIYSHPQTDCFVLSELFSVARQVTRSKTVSKPIQLYVRLSLRPLGQQAYHVWLREFLRHYVVTAAAVCLHLYTLSASRVLSSFEELCILRAAAENSFTRVLNPHGGAYIYILFLLYLLILYFFLRFQPFLSSALHFISLELMISAWWLALSLLSFLFLIIFAFFFYLTCSLFCFHTFFPLT